MAADGAVNIWRAKHEETRRPKWTARLCGVYGFSDDIRHNITDIIPMQPHYSRRGIVFNAEAQRRAEENNKTSILLSASALKKITPDR
jgi:hypothetical protein